MPDDFQISEIADRLGSSVGAELPRQEMTSKRAGHFEVQQLRSVQIFTSHSR